MDVDARDGGDRTPSCSDYSSPAECLVWKSLERVNFFPFGKMNTVKLIGFFASFQEGLKNVARNLQFIFRYESDLK
jgi:hypothetical protein